MKITRKKIMPRCAYCHTTLGITTFKPIATVHVKGKPFMVHPECKEAIVRGANG